MGQLVTVGGHEVMVYTAVVYLVDVVMTGLLVMAVNGGSVQEVEGSGERVTMSGVDTGGGQLGHTMVVPLEP